MEAQYHLRFVIRCSFVLIVAMLLGAQMRIADARAEAAAEDNEISVTGDAPFVGVPETVAVRMSLEQTAGSAREAAELLDGRTNQLRDSVKSAGIPADVRAIGDVIGSAGALRAGVPLTVRRQLLVESSDRSKAGALIDLLLKTPGASITPPEYVNTGGVDAVHEATALASTRAHAKAERVAAALGVKLGPLLSVIVTEEPEGEAIREKLAGGGPMGSANEVRLRVFASVRYAIARP